MHQLIEKLIAQIGAKGWTVIASGDRRKVLPGSDYVVNCIEVSGLQCVRHDNDIPAKYGINQCIGDTIGPGGLFKALRTVPVWLDVLKDIEELCPQALVLNYTNPMNMMCLAAARTRPSLQVVGLCHSVQGTSHLLAKRAGVAIADVEWECGGHQSPGLVHEVQASRQGSYPLLMKKAQQDLAGKLSDPDDLDLVRKDMMLHFGAFITESSGHLSEYLPYYRKRKDLLKQYARRATTARPVSTPTTGRRGARMPTSSATTWSVARCRSSGSEAGNTRAGLLRGARRMCPCAFTATCPTQPAAAMR